MSLNTKSEMKWLPIKVTSSYDKATTEWCQTFYPEHLASTNYFLWQRQVTIVHSLLYKRATDCWGTWQMSSNTGNACKRKRSSCPFWPLLTITMNNLVRWTMIEKNAHKSFWKSLRAHSSFLKNPHHMESWGWDLLSEQIRPKFPLKLQMRSS